MNRSTPRRFKMINGFTLIELLVVIAIISLLVSILMPSLKKAKDAAKAALCMSNLRNHGVAVIFYSDEYKGMLPHGGYQELNPLQNHLSWKVMLAPYHGLENLTDSTVDELVERGVFSCPVKGDTTCGNTQYGDVGYYGGYAWNWMYAGFLNQKYVYPRSGWTCTTFVNMSSVESSSSTIVIQDSNDRDLPTSAQVNFYMYPGIPQFIVTRHNGDSCNNLWLDGHVSLQSQESLDNNPRWFKISSTEDWYLD
jgi:prepilin-type N-terminal cleavage/methylation domain-containing protein/prepilin-type processing-associated H-X9-DG protein